MGKSKFKVGDKVRVLKAPITIFKICQCGDIGEVIDVSPFTVEYDGKTRSAYTVRFKNNLTWTFFSYELEPYIKPATPEKEDCGPYGYIPSFNKEEAKLNSPIFQPIFKVGDIVIDPMAKFIPNIGKIVKFVEENGKYYYTVEFTDKKTNIYLEQQLCKGSLNDKFLYDEFAKIGELSEGIGSKDKCKYCKTPFEEIEESKEEPGVCEYCIEQRHLIPEVNLRKACNVDLNEFSTFGHEGDWLEVTEWTNHEGFDVTIHYVNDHVETDHNFKLSYDELSAIINIVNKFGMLPAIFTKAPEE